MITGAPASGPGTGADFFNNFFGGGSSPTPYTPPAPAAPTTPPAAPPVVTPRTPPPPTPVNNSPIVSTTGVSNQYDDISNQLEQLQQGNAHYANFFQSQIANEQNANALKNQQAISSATAKTANAENMNNAQEASTLYGIRAAAAANGQSRYAPAQTALQTAAAQNSFQFKYNQLDQQEKLAIASANAAKTTGDIKTMGEMVQFIKEAQAQKLDLYKTAIQQSQFSQTNAIARANLGLNQQKFGFEQYQYGNPSAYQQAQLALAMGYGAPTSTSTSPFYSVINHVFGSNLGTSTTKTPNSGNGGGGNSGGQPSGTTLMYNTQGQALYIPNGNVQAALKAGYSQ